MPGFAVELTFDESKISVFIEMMLLTISMAL